jgi:transcriptional regulator with XRE-family HTH domain
MTAHSRVARQAVDLLGTLIKRRRLELKLKAADLAERAGVSRALIYRIERGDPGCSVGAVFEAATIVRVPLFDDESGRAVAERLRQTERELTLLPKAARTSKAPVRDDF